MRWNKCAGLIAFLWSCAAFAADNLLPNTEPLTISGDLSAQMVEGIDRFLTREISESVATRPDAWHRDFSSHDAYEKSLETSREHLRRMLGVIDDRLPVTALELVETTERPAKIADTEKYEVYAVRWPVLRNVYAEGLWLKPKIRPVARIVALPDADQTPEMLAGLVPNSKPEAQFARRLANNSFEVLIPTLISRADTFSGNRKLNRFTNQPHREWIYRQAFELGHHVIGYEIEKVLAAVDWFSRPAWGERAKIGVVGYGEGGLIALNAAALDSRVDAALVSGYFAPRQQMWSEPIYRNVFGLLREFGDAEVATMIAPRGLIIEHSIFPKVDGPPAPHDGRAGAAPGKIATIDYQLVENEFERAKALLKEGGTNFTAKLKLICGTEGRTTGPGSDRALTEFVGQLGGTNIDFGNGGATTNASVVPDEIISRRQERQVAELADYTQGLLRDSERTRQNYFWSKMKAAQGAEAWNEARKEFQTELSDEVIGAFQEAEVPLKPRSRKIMENEKFTGYDVMLDVFPDVFAWGVLLLPNDLKPGEKRPVVVCQHGLEGVPMDVITTDEKNPSFPYYKGFATQLAERGFIVFAPHNPYRGGDKFRVLQRKANPLGKSLFSIIVAQHNRILDWLSEQPFVDVTRIGFYGLSYGGKTAMRVPALIDRYALSICSGDFNEWIWKNATVDFPASYMFTGEYEMPEFNLGNTFNYAEMAALIAPRPFMVERGHNDGVSIDEQVSYEYAKVRRMYDVLGIGDRTEIEFFNGPHQIHGVGTFEFLHKHLRWPER